MTLLVRVKSKLKTCRLNSWRGSNVIISKAVTSKYIVSNVIVFKSPLPALTADIVCYIIVLVITDLLVFEDHVYCSTPE
jgi:hypothetical protein